MEIIKRTCELCSMDATFLKANTDGLVHYYCEHHAPNGATRIGKSSSAISTYLPVISIYVSAVILSILLATMTGMWGAHMLMLYFMGFTFLTFGFFKVLDVSAFADGYQDYDIIAQKSRTYALLYPFIELLLAGLYLADIGGIYRDTFTLILMIVGSIGVFKKLQANEEIPCVCLGVVFKLPMTKVTLFENGLMSLMALSMLLMYLGG